MLPRTHPLERTRPTGGDGQAGSPPAFGDGGGPGWEPSPVATARVGLWIFLVAVTMLFIAFTVSYLSRRSAPDWTPIALPRLLWANTAVILAGSAALEWGRRARRGGAGEALRRGLTAAAALGVLFLLGQIAAWRQLASTGIFMSSGPHSAFFYLLTAVHGLHLLGGLGGLGYALRRTSEASVQAATLYWHFLAGLWVTVFMILVFI